MLRYPAIVYFMAIVILVFIQAGCKGEKIDTLLNEYEKSGGKLKNVKSIAVLDFTGNNRGCGESIAISLANHLRLFGYVKVIDPVKIRAILLERGVSLEGGISPEKAAEIAGVLKADCLLYGKAEAFFFSEVKYRESELYPGYQGPGISIFVSQPVYNNNYVWPVPNVYLKRKGNVTMDIHIFDAGLSKEVGIINPSKSYFHEYNCNEFEYDKTNPYGPYWFDRLKKRQMPSNRDMILVITDNLFNMLIEEFVPYYISRMRELQKDIPGADLALQGKWEDARKVWEKASSNAGTDMKRYINLGIFYERQCNLQTALDFYERALKLSPGNEMLANYINETKIAAESMRPVEKLEISEKIIQYRVVEIKDDGRVYINAGEEKGIKPGDLFLVIRYSAEFDRDLVTVRGGYYYPVCSLKIDKVFEGVCQGSFLDLAEGLKPAPGDPVVQKDVPGYK